MARLPAAAIAPLSAIVAAAANAGPALWQGRRDAGAAESQAAVAAAVFDLM
jgi:hypothetical protein